MKSLSVYLAVALAFGSLAYYPSSSNAMSPGTDEHFKNSPSEQSSEAQKLTELTYQYFQEWLQRNPLMATVFGVHDYNDQFTRPLSPTAIEETRAFEKRYLDAVLEIDSDRLTGQDWINYEIFKYARQKDLEGLKFDSEYLPLDQYEGAHLFFAMLGSGMSYQPFNSTQDYENFMRRAEGFALYIDSALEYMQKGIERGVVLPRPIAEKVLPQLASQVLDDVTESVFYKPVTLLKSNETIPQDRKAELQARFIETIETVIMPAYKRAYEYMATDYLPHTRETVGLSALPEGKAWYEYQIENHTTLPLDADAIHEFGQQEVARILNEMNKVRSEVGFEGDLAAFFEHVRTSDEFYFQSEQALIEGYLKIKKTIDARLPKLFSVFPKEDYEVRAIEPYRAASAAGASYYPPARDGSRPGIFYINTHNLKAQPRFLMETLSLHEASPGHHFQMAIQFELENVPEFRKFGRYSVFMEGWALYAESLGKDLGLFTDPYMWFGRLTDEQLRAMRLVVDTGLHAKGWSREQAIEFMLANSSIAESDAVAEVERYIVIPGQAVSYKVGERHLLQLRHEAQSALGDRFDIREFHSQILLDGAMPMPILSKKIRRWIESQLGEG